MAALAVVAIVAVVVGGVVLYLVAHVMNKVVRFLRHFAILWRFLVGRPLDGVHRTNATFWQHPTKALHPTADKSWWHWRKDAHRAGMRLGVVLAVSVIGAGLWFATVLTLAVLGTLTAAGLICGLLWAYVRIRRYQHYRTWERPLHRALTPVLGGPPARLAIERDRSAVTLQLPEAFTGDEHDRAAIVHAVTTKLALEAPDVDWSRLTGKQPVVTFTRSQPPPSRVTWADVEQAIRNAGPADLMCGIGKKDADVFVSTKQDSPHFGEAMGTGAGKSNAAAFWLIQELMRGSVALVLDAKWISHPWTFKDMDASYDQLPNVAYARTTRQLHDAMVWLGVELQRRTEAADRYVNAKGDVLGDVGPTFWIIAEEMNLAVPRLKQYLGVHPRPEGRPEAVARARRVRCRVVRWPRGAYAPHRHRPDADRCRARWRRCPREHRRPHDGPLHSELMEDADRPSHAAPERRARPRSDHRQRAPCARRKCR